MDSKIRRRKFTVSPSGNWISQARFAEFRRKSRHAVANSDLYHYAGNNPVKYTDPDGEIDLPFFSLGDFFGFLSQITSGSDRITATAVAAANGKETSKSRLETLSPYMCEAMSKISGEAVVGGMRFVADHGSEISLVCYATGNVEMGIVIDGISTSCDITLAIHDYLGSDRTTSDKIILGTDIGSTIVSTLGSGAASDEITKGMKKLGQEEFNKKLTNMLSNVIGTEFDSCIDNIAGEIFE